MAEAASRTLDAGAPLVTLRPELDCVLHGLKPAARHTMRQSRAAAAVDALEALGLHAAFFEPADPRAGIAYLAPAEQARLLREPRGHLLYAPTRRSRDRLIDAHAAQDNEAIGAMLGYPSCCVEANLLYDELPYNDYVRTARVSERFDWRLNLYVGGWTDRYGRQLQLVSHFPCSLACERSAALAEERLLLLGRTAPDLAETIGGAARMAILLHDDSGLPPEHRTGLCGAALEAIHLGGELLVAGVRCLREGNELPPLVPRATRIARDGGDLLVEGREPSDRCRLEGSAWMLLLPE